MTYLVRKITMSKWSVSDEPGPVNADAITHCLKTSGNTLSFWRVDSPADVAQGVLAIAAANDRLDTIDIVVIDESQFLEKGIEIRQTPGQTVCSDLVDTHRDLAQLNITHLGFVSDAIADQIRQGKTERFTLTKLRVIILDALKSGRLSYELLSEGIQKKIPHP
ncbi:hypothetical protein [Pseudomonas sp. OA65]|uniref:hypothetical protein n=1 Tax=Pseudomonas sp. OA65 TaxID=2818431 RepID=UPI001A9E42C3|nr:hypothetical protein [Pseudomonas sp. OA65]MBO1537574.1 hypothetical protein [Pseudomonas sp. OA65]